MEKGVALSSLEQVKYWVFNSLAIGRTFGDSRVIAFAGPDKMEKFETFDAAMKFFRDNGLRPVESIPVTSDDFQYLSNPVSGTLHIFESSNALAWFNTGERPDLVAQAFSLETEKNQLVLAEIHW